MASILAGASNVTISGGNFSIHQSNSDRVGPTSAFDKLSQAAAHSALHNAPARTDETRCHHYTRINVLDGLERWVQSICNEDGSMFWLHGGAGAGKSAVMQTLAERCVAQGLTLGSFFFSRSDPTRNTAEVLIATLLYQLVQLLPSIMDFLAPVIDHDPLIFKKSLQVQCEYLLVPALQHLLHLGHISDDFQTPQVFLIDGLDECNDTLQQHAIIRAMTTVCHEHHLPVHVLIASRPEYAISTSFESYKREHPGLSTMSLSEDADAEADIRRFIEDEFVKIRTTHPFRYMIPSGWPTFYNINGLVLRSSSHFIYASTAVKYIWTTKENPVRSLDVVLGLQTSRTTSPFAELDALYRHILESAAHLDQVLQIFAHCIFPSLSPDVYLLCVMLECSVKDLSIFLADMGPLVLVSKRGTSESSYGLSKSVTSLSYNSDDDVQLLHQSLPDFLCDKARSLSLHISRGAYYPTTIKHCFRILNQLSQNQYSTAGWFTTDWKLDLGPLYYILTTQILNAIKHSIDIAGTRELLKLCTLRNFHECQLSLSLQHHQSDQNDYDGWGGCGFYADDFSPYLTSSCNAEDLFIYLQCLKSTTIEDGGPLFRSTLEDFFDIFESYLRLECKPLATVILPLLFSGYSATCTCDILYYSCFTQTANPFCNIERFGHFEPKPLYDRAMSFQLFEKLHYRHLSNNPGYFALGDLASVHHSINNSSSHLTKAAEAIVRYLAMSCLQRQSSSTGWTTRTTPHQTWLRKQKPRKHHSIGSPALASRFHRRCLNKYVHSGTDDHLRRIPKYRQYLKRIGLLISSLDWKTPVTGYHDSLYVGLMHALIWLLPKASYSEYIGIFSTKEFSKGFYRRDPQLCDLLRKSLNNYSARVREEKIQGLSKAINEGDVDALIEKSRMLHLNTQD